MKSFEDVEFEYNFEKNLKLKEERGIGFDDMVYYINQGYVIDVVNHHNPKYAHQQFYVLDIEGYVYMVPFVRGGNRVFLKTIFPSRKATKQYLREKKDAKKNINR